jgi:hypothetical protein
MWRFGGRRDLQSILSRDGPFVSWRVEGMGVRFVILVGTQSLWGSFG